MLTTVSELWSSGGYSLAVTRTGHSSCTPGKPHHGDLTCKKPLQESVPLSLERLLKLERCLRS